MHINQLSQELNAYQSCTPNKNTYLLSGAAEYLHLGSITGRPQVSLRCPASVDKDMLRQCDAQKTALHAKKKAISSISLFCNYNK